MSITTKTDCFAYNVSKIHEHRCCALDKRYCDYQHCSFYKHKDSVSQKTKDLIEEMKYSFTGGEPIE